MTTITLNVPLERKDEAKALGARWNRFRRIWYVKAEADLSPFRALGFLTDAVKAMTTTKVASVSIFRVTYKDEHGVLPVDALSIKGLERKMRDQVRGYLGNGHTSRDFREAAPAIIRLKGVDYIEAACELLTREDAGALWSYQGETIVTD